MNNKNLQIIFGLFVVLMVPLLLMSPKSKSNNSSGDLPSVQSFRDVINLFADVQKTKVEMERITSKELLLFTQEDLNRNPFELLMEVSTKEHEHPHEEEVEEPVVEEPLPEFEIEGILFDSDDIFNSTVIILGDEKRVGDYILGWQITRINEGSIFIANGGREQEISLYGAIGQVNEEGSES